MTSVALLIAIAAITPGPNNLFVMRAASLGGLGGALRSIVAVVLGGLVVLALVMGGVGAVLDSVPQARVVIAMAGAAYLGWLGSTLLWKRNAGQAGASPASDASAASYSLSSAGLFAFQFFNPKGWVMALTVFAAASSTHRSTPSMLLLLALLYALIPTLCLSLWSALGVWLTTWLNRPRNRAFFERTMGLLLVGSALSLAIEVTSHQAIG